MSSDSTPTSAARQGRADTESPQGSKASALTFQRVGVSFIAGIAVSNLTENEAVAEIDKLIAEGGSHYAAVVNAAKIVAANQDERLKRTLLGADLVTADGMSVVWASRVLGHPLPERVTGIELFQRLVEHAAGHGLSVYFLGGREEAARGVAEILGGLYPSLKVAGHRNGYFDASEEQAVCEAIRSSGAELLFVATGSPRQEFWIASNLTASGVRFAMGVGGSFDHLSGLAKRAPRWMQQIGLEWFYRLVREPRRLWKRYLVGNLVFIWLIAKQLVLRSHPS